MTKNAKHTPSIWWASIVGVYKQIDEQNLSLISAGIAFFGMLAIFPGLAALIAIFGLWSDPVVIQEQLSLLQGIVPEEIFTLLNDQLTRVLSAAQRPWAGRRACRSCWRFGPHGRASAR